MQYSIHSLKETLFHRAEYITLAPYYILIIALALWAERADIIIDAWHFNDYTTLVCLAIAALALLRAFIIRLDYGFLFFFLPLAFLAIIGFRSTANHTFLALWLLCPIAFFPFQHLSRHYSDYIRITLGIVMVVAATQKLISGNFLNGLFLQHLASGDGGYNEEILSYFCFGQDVYSCNALVYMSIASVIWQYAIGLCLLINLRNISVILAELLFVLGVGFITDEMNFQVINVAAILVAYRLGCSPLIFVFFGLLLIVDYFSIYETMRYFLSW